MRKGQMRKYQQALYRDIQRERANVKALERHIKRLKGKEVNYYHHASPEADIARLERAGCAEAIDDLAQAESWLKIHRMLLANSKKEAARLKEQHGNPFPVTLKTLLRRLFKRKRRRKSKRRS